MIANEANTLSRRAFLSASGALVVALAAPAEFARADLIERSIIRKDKLSSYISIERDGTVVAYYGKIDGGQGLESAIAQLGAHGGEHLSVFGYAVGHISIIPEIWDKSRGLRST